MFVSELDTFVKKFHQLWNDGFTAHLDLDTRAENAWVGLQADMRYYAWDMQMVIPKSEFYAHEPVIYNIVIF